ncbi:MAG: AsmA-like C-terminal region-containing protein, partial [Chthoniobacterales bacterium]
MDENGTTSAPAWRVWLKRVGIAFGIVVLLLIVFHRPILQTVARRAAIYFAAKQNLKLDLRVEGSVLGGITLRNVRAVATGPSALQSGDADLVRVDYSLWGYLHGGLAKLLQDIEVRNATIVVDPEKAPPAAKVVQEKKITLPAFFPDRLTLADVNVRVKSKPEDLVLEHLYLDLNPKTQGELRIAKLQLTNGRTWKTVTAQTTYQNHDLFLRNLILDDQTHLDVVNLDASKIGSGQLDVSVKGTFAGAKLDGTVSLGEAKKSLGTKIDFKVDDTSIEAVTQYFQPAKLEEGRIKAPKLDAEHAKPSELRGKVQHLAIVGEGRLDTPNSWNGSIKGEFKDLGAGGIVFDNVSLDVKAVDGRAEVKNLVLTRGENKITVEGSADLPARTEEFGRVPASFKLRASVPELGSLTAGMAQPITGPAEVNGQITVRDSIINIDLAAVAGPVNFGTGSVEHAVVKLQAEKKMPPPMPDEEDVGGETIPPPYYSNLTSQIGLEISAVRFGDYAVDSLTAKVQTKEKNVTLEQMLAVRGENRFTAQARYELPLDFGTALSQPGRIEGHLAAPQVSDFWIADAEKPVTGAVDLDFQTDLGQKLAGGSFKLSGTNLSAQKLTVPQINAEGTIADNVVHLKDLTAQLNESDFVRASGQASLDEPHAYAGKLEMKVAKLEAFEPVLRAMDNKSELAGSLAVNWEGNGALTGFKNTGDLKLKLENGRYGDLKKLEATVDANYTPQELNVPIVYLSSDKMMVQAIMQAKDRTLEVTRLQVDQGEAKYASGYVSIPFVWANLGTEKPLFPSDGKVLVNFQTENLDIEKL